jgi:bacterioferritin
MCVINNEEVRAMKAATLTKRETNARMSESEGVTQSAVDRRALIDGLNHDLAGEYQSIVMYTQYSAKLTGPHRGALRALFLAEIADEQGHAQFLADKIASLGGEPTTEPRAVRRADQPREMLEQALAAEKQAIADYDERLCQADTFGDIGLKVRLEDQLADETRHKEEIERILAGWEEC